MCPVVPKPRSAAPEGEFPKRCISRWLVVSVMGCRPAVHRVILGQRHVRHGN